MEEKLSLAEVQKCLAGIDYPKSKSELVSFARKNNCEQKVINALGMISKETLDDPADVSGEIKKAE